MKSFHPLTSAGAIKSNGSIAQQKKLATNTIIDNRPVAITQRKLQQAADEKQVQVASRRPVIQHKKPVTFSANQQPIQRINFKAVALGAGAGVLVGGLVGGLIGGIAGGLGVGAVGSIGGGAIGGYVGAPATQPQPIERTNSNSSLPDNSSVKSDKKPITDRRARRRPARPATRSEQAQTASEPVVIHVVAPPVARSNEDLQKMVNALGFEGCGEERKKYFDNAKHVFNTSEGENFYTNNIKRLQPMLATAWEAYIAGLPASVAIEPAAAPKERKPYNFEDSSTWDLQPLEGADLITDNFDGAEAVGNLDRLREGSLRDEHGRHQVGAPLHAHMNRGGGGIAFYYRHNGDRSVTPVVYDLATGRDGNNYLWRAGISNGPPPLP